MNWSGGGSKQFLTLCFNERQLSSIVKTFFIVCVVCFSLSFVDSLIAFLIFAEIKIMADDQVSDQEMCGNQSR